MKNYYTILLLILIPGFSAGQGTICNSSGNLMIFSNYDGGALNINVDVNIPNLKIGIIGYEATYIALSGAFVGNVTEVVYVGFNATNNHCGSSSSTSFSGLPSGATSNILFAPPATLSNPNGYTSMICAYSCSNTTNQGGCNTTDQVEAYFLNYFSGSVIYAHKVQYGCWSGTQSLTNGGTCCSTITPLSISASVSNVTCAGLCDGFLTPVVSGGTAPYSYSGTTNYTNLCSGNYTLIVTDNVGAIDSVTVSLVANDSTPAPTGLSPQEFCEGALLGDVVVNGSSIQWYDSLTGGSALNAGMPLISGFFYASQVINGCHSVQRLPVQVQVNAVDITTSLSGLTLQANASNASYQWIDCLNGNIPVSGAFAQTFTPTVNGSFAVVVTQNNCTDTSACTSVSGVGSSNHSSESVRIFPIPASNRLHIEIGVEMTGENFRISDLEGRKILEGTFHQQFTVLEVGKLAPGLYLLKIGDYWIRTFPIIKQ